MDITPHLTVGSLNLPRITEATTDISDMPEFRKITKQDMTEIMRYLKLEKGRSTDFSYGGILMWVDYYKYEFSIYRNTLFIKGVVETERGIPAFTLPLGELPLNESVKILKKYCRDKNMELLISAVPEDAYDDMLALSPISVEEIPEISDYIYDSESLAYLKGKKNGKKRNHVNQFINTYPEWKLVNLTKDNIAEAFGFMDKFDLEGDDNESAIAERRMTREVLKMIEEGDSVFIGAMLYAGDEVCGITIGDLKGDTLYVHIEKALREYPGSYEMINKEFAKYIVESYPQIKYINREDDTGDEGLRRAKESYHPIKLLKKYTVRFN